MADGKIYVDFSNLDSNIRQLENLKDEYRSTYETELYSNVMEEVKSAFSGPDCDAFVTKVEEFRDDFMKITDVIQQYIDHLKKVRTDYQNTQDALAQSMKALKGDRS